MLFSFSCANLVESTNILKFKSMEITKT